MKEYSAQALVIAAGPSGLSAAVQAAMEGLSVIVLEKTAAIGGAANMGMGPLGIGTKYQKQSMVDLSVEKAFRMFMEYTHYNVDARLVKRYFEQSADTIEWLEDMGVQFEGAFKYFPQSEATWHIVKTDTGIGPRAASFMTKALFEKAKELGITVLTETPAKKILFDGGKVSGVLAADKTGEEITVNCQAAIICTGGAGSDKNFIKEQTGFDHGRNLFSFAIPGLVGDGIKMAWEAGAGKMPVRIEMAASVEGADDLPGSVPNVFSQPNLLINLHGRRVMNEAYMQNSTYLSNVVAHQKDMVCLSVVDSSIVKNYIRNGVDNVSFVRIDPDVSDFYDGLETAKKLGVASIYEAGTLEELAEKMGVDAERFAETVEDYNDYCDSTDEEFFKEKRYLRPITKAPFYAARIRPGGYGTVGGIRINANCEVCGEDFEPIAGLYAAGADACNIYDDSYMFLLPGNSMGFAVNTGRIAGMSAAEYLES